jgi:hypothetical protein
MCQAGMLKAVGSIELELIRFRREVGKRILSLKEKLLFPEKVFMI